MTKTLNTIDLIWGLGGELWLQRPKFEMESIQWGIGARSKVSGYWTLCGVAATPPAPWSSPDVGVRIRTKLLCELGVECNEVVKVIMPIELEALATVEGPETRPCNGRCSVTDRYLRTWHQNMCLLSKASIYLLYLWLESYNWILIHFYWNIFLKFRIFTNLVR